MSREILFKAKRKDNREEVEGYYRADPDLDIHFICGWNYYPSENGLERESFEYEIDPDTLCQYTGLNDNTKWGSLTEKQQKLFLSKWNYREDRKNTPEDWKGKKIWENDIVAFLDTASTESSDSEANCCGLVSWDIGTASFRVANMTMDESYEVLSE